ncbi:phospho-2-dehydro-3-deoxyheptonate aldolase, class II [Rhodopirellula maiorica SM1]|uniref:Phospho-2-dehydro-3-deoxyheptonate aldolase n=1 Tax=Rhodopirellula maiorica SM1 TaxID=1265738 RepID=M5R9W2_9BACT|nr:3-deoxy-7-phosphoheptulonate synthase class II [Rhodopirellula maiorica]EMI15826.1 phospho-2-dehydro-3-deoxyheptonate aldolase, class II [Rhodopirellula maiorica SM1]
MSDWDPSSWRAKTALQQPIYADSDSLQGVLQQLGDRPPLVTRWEIDRLKTQLALAANGDAFLLQGGDCSESFAACRADPIEKKLKVLLQMSLVLVYGLKKPIIRVGRIAGQYAKPRSSDTETRDGVTLPSYRGDCVNRSPFTPEDRLTRPQNLLAAYEHSAQTLNYLRALTEGGFADLKHPENWELDFVSLSPQSDEYHQMVRGIGDSLNFLDVLGGVTRAELSRVDFYTSHEALLLAYEEALTRQPSGEAEWYNLGTHFPWIGDRTRMIDGAHVEYFRGIKNPIAVKVGPSTTSDGLIELLDLLNPEREVGRMTLICRFGAERIAESLPLLIAAVQQSNHPVLWSVDPMHGNTMTTENGIKTRHFDQILSEVRESFAIHARHGTIVGGIHLELTGNNVTECIGGAGGLSSGDLSTAYESNVDPRLNYEQAMEIAFLIAKQARVAGPEL